MIVLGAGGSKSPQSAITSFLITPKILIDCGNLIQGLGKEFTKVEHIFLTHTHFDHIADLPLAIDTYFSDLKRPLKIYATQASICNLQDHIFNHKIWPDFSQIKLANNDQNVIEYVPVSLDTPVCAEGITFRAIKNNHTAGSCGFVINDEVLLTSDTYLCDTLWQQVNDTPSITKVVTDVSFVSQQQNLANISKHLTPSLLQRQLQILQRNDVSIYLHHLKDSEKDAIKTQLQELDIDCTVLEDGQQIALRSVPLSNPEYQKRKSLSDTITQQKRHIHKLNEISIALSCEHDKEKLLEMILDYAKDFVNADAGTLYLMSEDKKQLEFQVVMTDSLGIVMTRHADNIKWPPLKLYDSKGNPNDQMAAARTALSQKIINIEDVYESDAFNFSGTKEFDESTGYRSKSMLVIPLNNHENEVIGVCQLINRQDENGTIISFDSDDEFSIKALASQAAVAINNANLINSLENLLDSFIKSIAWAIDAKSPHTGGHVKKVAVLTEMIAKAINEDNEKKFKKTTFNKDELKELEIAALMHDVGKIATPTHIMDKSTKLETISDRIHFIKQRFELLKVQKQLANDNQQETMHAIDDDFSFLQKVNVGEEPMDEEKIKRIHKIAAQKITVAGQEQNLLSDDEVQNLCITKGTLTTKEIQIMREHATISNQLLAQLPFPKKLSNVPSIAGGHHEKLNGKGYPKGIDRNSLSLQARILAIADIFEALSASDRPYKQAKKLSEITKILDFMIKDDELDQDIIELIYDKNLHHRYAKQYLKASQCDFENN